MIGTLPKGKNKWYGTILGGDGCFYGIPYSATSVLRINPRTDDVRLIGNLPEGIGKWHGGSSTPDGKIYGYPSNSEMLLKITTPKYVVGQIDDDENHGVIVEEVPILYSNESDRKRKYKWGGGCRDTEGNIFSAPDQAQTVLRIDVKTGEAITFGNVIQGSGFKALKKYQGCVLACDGNIYCVPADSETVLKILPKTLELETIGVLPKQEKKFQGGFVASDNNIYCIPEHSTGILKINPLTNEIDLIESFIKKKLILQFIMIGHFIIRTSSRSRSSTINLRDDRLSHFFKVFVLFIKSFFISS